MCKTLKKLLKSMHVEGIHEELAVQDAKLGAAIKVAHGLTTEISHHL